MNCKKLLVQIFFGLFLLCISILYFRDASNYQITEIPAGSGTFTAASNVITSIVICNEDTSLHDQPDRESCNVEITITDTTGTIVATCEGGDLHIHTNGYTNSDSTLLSDLPIYLEEGNTYKLNYRASMKDGRELSDLSFLLYGERKISFFFYGIFFLLIFIAGSLAIWYKGNRTMLVYSLLWWTLILATMTSMVTLMPQKDSGAFADVYSLSSELMGKADTDAEGYCYIEESGLRNSGYLSYRIPIVRFWTHNNIGNSVQVGKISLLYRVDDRKNILQLPAVMMLTLVRLIHAPWQSLWIGIWLLQALAAYSILLWLLHYTKDRTIAQTLIYIVGILPSVQMAILSCTEAGLAFLLYFSCVLHISWEGKTLLRKKTVLTDTIIMGVFSLSWGVQTLRLARVSFQLDQVLEELAMYRPEQRLYFLPFILLFLLIIATVRYGRENKETKRAIPAILCPVLMAVAWALSFDSSGFILLPVLVLPYRWGNQCRLRIGECMLVRLAAVLAAVTALIRLLIR